MLEEITVKNFFLLAATVICAALPATPASPHKAHEHGAARMNLSVEGQKAEIELEVPLADLVGFEHAPETDAQKKAVRDMAEIMHNAGALFIFPVEADCRPEKVSLESDALGDDLLAAPAAQGRREEKAEESGGHEQAGEKHADLDAEWTFICRNPEKLKSIELSIFKYFPSLREITVQMVTPEKQGAAGLTPRSAVLRW
jgi:hypothetical protein